MDNWYLYRHIRLDKNEPFYIGIGCTLNYKRAYTKRDRSDFWNKIVKKHNYHVEIVLDMLTKEEAFKKEKEFIKLYGKIKNNGLLCNITDGGEGGCGNSFKLSDEAKQKISKARIGIHLSNETKKKLREINLGKKMPEETKKKIKDWNKNVGFNEEQRLKMSKAASFKRSDETKKRMSESMKGKTYTDEAKQKIRDGMKKWNQENKRPEEYYKNISERMKGNKYSLGNKTTEETKDKISKSIKNWWENNKKIII